jgi:acetyl esterase/lipase
MPADFSPDERIVYKRIGDIELHLNVFPPDDSRSRLPAIVFFHGGGWVHGDPGQFHPHCRYLADRGMVAVSAQYRLENAHGTPPYACVADGKSAMRWVRSHAEQLGIDPERLAAGGGSAGGHVAAATASLSGFGEDDEDGSVSPRPDALVLFNPVFDNGPGGYGHERVKDRWREFSPLHNVHEGMPPALVMLGDQDKLLPVATVVDFKNRMEAVGSRCEVRVYPGEGHAFFNYNDGGNPWYTATVHAMDRFLASLGWLQGEPTVPPPEVDTISQ